MNTLFRFLSICWVSINIGMYGMSQAYASSTSTPAKPYIAWIADQTSSNFILSWDMWWGENGSTVKLEENGTIITTSTISPNSPQAQKGTFPLVNKTSGSYSYRVLLCNGDICTPSDAKTIRVTLPGAVNTSSNTVSNNSSGNSSSSSSSSSGNSSNSSTSASSDTGANTTVPPVNQTNNTPGNIFISDDTKRMVRMATPISGTPTIDFANPSNNPANVIRVMRILPETKWNEIFPVRKSIYTYSELLKAVAKFPGFCNDVAPGNSIDMDTACKTELATIFAHMVQETGGHSPSGYLPDNLGTTYEEWRQGLYFIREYNCTNDGVGCEYRGDSCDANGYFGKIWPCPIGAKYFGRGAHQLSYNFNYGEFSQVVFGDSSVLLNDPDRIARDGWLAMSSAIWFYMTPHSPKPSMHDVVVGYWKENSYDIASGNLAGFGATTNIINGGIECGKGTETAGSLNRIKYFRAITNALGGRLGNNLECGASKMFPSNGSAVVPSYFEQSWDGSKTCQMVSWQTGFSIFVPDSYKHCVEYYFHVTPTNIPDLSGRTGISSGTSVNGGNAGGTGTTTQIVNTNTTTSTVTSSGTSQYNASTSTGTSSVQVGVQENNTSVSNSSTGTSVSTQPSSTQPLVSTQNTSSQSSSIITQPVTEGVLLPERKLEILINLGEGLRNTPRNFVNKATFYEKYSYAIRSSDEKKLLDNFWNILTKKRTGVTKVRVRTILSNLANGLRVNAESFITRDIYNTTYGYDRKTPSLQGVLEEFWGLLGK